MKVGLTGGIGSGKTTVSDGFSALQVPVIDADIIARQALDTDKPAFRQTVKLFGNDILDDNGDIDRWVLRQIVFTDSSKRRALEQIVHPVVRAEIEAQAGSLQSPYCIIVIPLLIESGMQHLVDRVLVVTAEKSRRVERICRRDDIPPADAERIMSAQINETERLSHADDVIENNGDLKQLKSRVAELHRQYQVFAEK